MTSTELDELRARVIALLEQERRALHTGEIAVRLGVATHQVHTAMHVPLQRGQAWFHSSEGYSLPPASRGRDFNTDQFWGWHSDGDDREPHGT